MLGKSDKQKKVVLILVKILCFYVHVQYVAYNIIITIFYNNLHMRLHLPFDLKFICFLYYEVTAASKYSGCTVTVIVVEH